MSTKIRAPHSVRVRYSALWRLMVVLGPLGAVFGGCGNELDEGGLPTELEAPRAQPDAITPATASAASVSTDREDYAPGEVVTITGAGWQPGETV